MNVTWDTLNTHNRKCSRLSFTRSHSKIWEMRNGFWMCIGKKDIPKRNTSERKRMPNRSIIGWKDSFTSACWYRYGAIKKKEYFMIIVKAMTLFVLHGYTSKKYSISIMAFSGIYSKGQSCSFGAYFCKFMNYSVPCTWYKNLVFYWYRDGMDLR